MVEPVTKEILKSQLRVLHDDDDDLIMEYLASARARCEQLTGRVLVSETTEAAALIDPTIKQAIRMLVGGYHADRDGNGHTEKAEKAVQNLLFNARLMIHELPTE